MRVEFSEQAEASIQHAQPRYPQLRSFIAEVLAQDPRPAYRQQAEDEREYGVHLYEFNVRWRVKDGVNQVIALDPV